MIISCKSYLIRASISDGLGLRIHGFKFGMEINNLYNLNLDKPHFKILNLGNTPPQTQHKQQTHIK